MASLNLTDARLEYLFSEPEKILAKQLDPLHIMWIQTKYAQTWKGKASLPVPADPKDYPAYFIELASFEGQLATLQGLLDDHIEANSILHMQKLAAEESKKREESDVAKRASELVNK